MPQPISKERVEEYSDHLRVKFTRHKLLGYIAQYTPDGRFLHLEDNKLFAYRMDRSGMLLWVTERTIKRRMKTGYANSKKAQQTFRLRKKPILPESTFSLDELEQAAAIMEDLP